MENKKEKNGTGMSFFMLNDKFKNSQDAIIIGSAGPGRKGITVFNEMDVQRFFAEENYLSPDAQKWIRSKITEYPCEIWDLVLLRQKD